MKQLGFGREGALNGIEYCIMARLIEPVVILTGQYLLEEPVSRLSKERYCLTLRGAYYLREITTWKEYIFYQKVPFKTIKQLRGFKTLEIPIVSFLRHLVYIDDLIYKKIKDKNPAGGKTGYLRINLDDFIDTFEKTYGIHFQAPVRNDLYEFSSLSAFDSRTLINITSKIAVQTLKKSNYIVIINEEKNTIEIKRELVRRMAEQLQITCPDKNHIDLELCFLIVQAGYNKEFNINYEEL